MVHVSHLMQPLLLPMQDAGTGASGSENDDGSCWESASDEDIEDTELAAAEERQAASANGQTGAGMENADADAAAPDRLGNYRQCSNKG